MQRSEGYVSDFRTPPPAPPRQRRGGYALTKRGKKGILHTNHTFHIYEKNFFIFA